MWGISPSSTADDTGGYGGFGVEGLPATVIMAGIDDAVNDGALQKRFAADPISWAAKEYLSIEHMSVH